MSSTEWLSSLCRDQLIAHYLYALYLCPSRLELRCFIASLSTEHALSLGPSGPRHPLLKMQDSAVQSGGRLLPILTNARLLRGRRSLLRYLAKHSTRRECLFQSDARLDMGEQRCGQHTFFQLDDLIFIQYRLPAHSLCMIVCVACLSAARCTEYAAS